MCNFSFDLNTSDANSFSNIGNVGNASSCRSIPSVKSVRIRSYSVQHFPALGLNTKRYSVSLRTQSKCDNIRTRITSNTDTFYVVIISNEKISVISVMRTFSIATV